MKFKALILAAGKGTRMKSEILKVAHNIAGTPIVNYVINTVLNLGAEEAILIIGHQANLIKKITKHPQVTYALQKEQLGTGHAVMQTKSLLNLNENETLIILAGDCPLIKQETIENLLAIHKESNASGTILTTKMPEPATYGRILRGKMGTVTGIKEAKDCSKKELSIQEINTGIYCFQSQQLFKALQNTNNTNKQNEYYLTDVIHILKQQGEHIEAYCTPDHNQAIGINTRMDLAKINQIIYKQNNLHFMQEGVTIIDPQTTFIDSTVKIGHDTIIYPYTMIEGNSQIGTNCIIKPHTYINNGKIKNNQEIPPFSHINAKG